MGVNQVMPQSWLEAKRQHEMLASVIGVRLSTRVEVDGLYVALRSRRDPINTNRKRKYLTVRLRIDGVEVFRSEESVVGFPTDHLIAQLMLVT